MKNVPLYDSRIKTTVELIETPLVKKPALRIANWKRRMHVCIPVKQTCRKN